METAVLLPFIISVLLLALIGIDRHLALIERVLSIHALYLTNALLHTFPFRDIRPLIVFLFRPPPLM